MNKIFTIFRRVFTSVLPRRLPAVRVYAYQIFNRARESNDDFKTDKRKLWYDPHVLLKSYVNYANTINHARQESRGLRKLSIITLL